MGGNTVTAQDSLVRNLTVALSLALLSPTGSVMANVKQQHQIALIGTWTSIPDAPLAQKPDYPSEGLYRLQVNSDGSLTPLNVIKMKSPSWIVKSQDGRFAYTTNEENAGAVTALAIDRVGEVRVLNMVDSHGAQPTHATISPDGIFLFIANYSVAKGGAGVSVFPIQSDGRLGGQVQHFAFEQGTGAVKGRQDGGHAHSTTFTPDGKFLYVADLGDDKLHAFRYHAGKSQPLEADQARDVSFIASSGPRHMVFTPDGEHAFVITEMGGTIVIFNINNDRLEKVASVQLNTEDNSAEYKSGGGIILSPDGKFIIASNRGLDNKLLVFKIEANGMLSKQASYSAGGIEPRAFSFDNSGKYLYVTNVFTNNVILFRFDTKNGKLEALGNVTNIPNPTDIKFFN